MRRPTRAETARLVYGVGDALLAFLALNWLAVAVSPSPPETYLFMAIEATIAAASYRAAAYLQRGGGQS